jgi:hypothetical protein
MVLLRILLWYFCIAGLKFVMGVNYYSLQFCSKLSILHEAQLNSSRRVEIIYNTNISLYPTHVHSFYDVLNI